MFKREDSCRVGESNHIGLDTRIVNSEAIVCGLWAVSGTLSALTKGCCRDRSFCEDVSLRGYLDWRRGSQSKGSGAQVSDGDFEDVSCHLRRVTVRTLPSADFNPVGCGADHALVTRIRDELLGRRCQIIRAERAYVEQIIVVHGYRPLPSATQTCAAQSCHAVSVRPGASNLRLVQVVVKVGELGGDNRPASTH